MRIVFVTVLLITAGCPGAVRKELAGEDDEADATGMGGASPIVGECDDASHCVAQGPKCCDCPTHAVPVNNVAAKACANVDCPPKDCGSPMEAACVNNMCELVCSAVACDASCSDGFATDANGCLVCSCNVATATECTEDNQCARVKADCCGCEMGGEDTAVPVSEVAAHEAKLMCPASPSCPQVNTCAPDLAARCIAGECTLVSGPLPANACGRPDLPACPPGTDCVLNANDQATMQGVGVCQPLP